MGGGSGGSANSDGGTTSACTGVPRRMPVRTNTTAAAASPDGRIYLYAGWAPNGGLPYCQPPLLEYDPAHDSYRPLASGPFAIFAGPTLSFANGKLITLENKLGLYDPRTDTWTEGAAPPITMYNRAATVGPDGRVYFIGGEGVGGPDTLRQRADVYDPVADSWSPIPDLPFASYGDAAVTVGGRIYIMGINAAVFDPATGRWSQLESPPTPRYWMRAEVDGARQTVTLGGSIPGRKRLLPGRDLRPGSGDVVAWQAHPDSRVPVRDRRHVRPDLRVRRRFTDLVQVYGAGDAWMFSP